MLTPLNQNREHEPDADVANAGAEKSVERYRKYSATAMESGESSQKSAVSSARLSLAHPCSQLADEDSQACRSVRANPRLANVADISFDSISSLLTLVGLFLQGLMHVDIYQERSRNVSPYRGRVERGNVASSLSLTRALSVRISLFWRLDNPLSCPPPCV
jgi:hypothetical protein